MTSTLQQEAGRKLRFSSERTMSIAQRLYENGYITYMRTDSTTLSESAINAARNQAAQLYGEEYVSPVAAAVHPQGEERPGGARGHPARRRDVRHPGCGAPRARRRRIPALRADLAAHGGLADGRRPRHHAELADRRRCGRLGRRPAGGVLRERPHHHLRRLPQGLRGDRGRTGRRRGRRRREPAAAADRGPAASTPSSSPPTATPPTRRPATPRRR